MMIKEHQRKWNYSGLKRKANQFLVENPPAIRQKLNNLIATKDLSFAVSGEFTGTNSSGIDCELKKKTEEIDLKS